MSETLHPADPAARPAGPAGTHDLLAAAAEPAPSAVFAARRAELGISIEDIANQLKFAPRQIEALEAGEFERLPGGTFARGMIRSYSRLLKMEPEPLLAQLARSGLGRHAGPEEAVSLRAPIPFSERGKHGNLVYTVLSVVLLGVVAFFAIEWYQEKGGPRALTFVAPAKEGALPGAASLPPVSAAPAPDAAPQPVAAAPTAAPPGVERVVKPEPLASAASLPLAGLAQHTDAKLPPVASGKGRLVLRFDKDAWVQIKARNGVTLLAELNAAGSEKVIDGEPPFELTIGNAPNVHLLYNDRPVDLKPHYKVDVARFSLN